MAETGWSVKANRAPSGKGGVAARMGRYVCRGRTAATRPPSWNRCRSSGRKELLRSSGAPGVHPNHPLSTCVRVSTHIFHLLVGVLRERDLRASVSLATLRAMPPYRHVSSSRRRVRESTYAASAYAFLRLLSPLSPRQKNGVFAANVRCFHSPMGLLRRARSRG